VFILAILQKPFLTEVTKHRGMPAPRYIEYI